MSALQQTAPGNQRTAPATQTALAEKTVEQVQKNIQVLTGLPQSQLIPVMNYIASSLGVKCTYCHVRKDDKWDFVADEKPEKGTAREMIKMVQGINKGNFKGNPAVEAIIRRFAFLSYRLRCPRLSLTVRQRRRKKRRRPPIRF